MATTQNGWSTAPKSRTRITHPSTLDTAEVRAGDVATIFQYLVSAYHNEVEPVRIINGYRSPELNASVGGVASSNHISGTAIDINGDKHQYELHLPKRDRYANFTTGFSKRQIAAIRAILAYLEGTVKWGGDFALGYRDPMHFEISANSTKVSQIAAKIRRDSKPAPIPDPKPAVTRKTPRIEEVESMERIILGLFRHHLKRDPSPAEVDMWLTHYASTGGDLNNLWYNIANSPEANALRGK